MEIIIANLEWLADVMLGAGIGIATGAILILIALAVIELCERAWNKLRKHKQLTKLLP